MTVLLLVLFLAGIGYALSIQDFDASTASWYLGSLSRVFHAGFAQCDLLIYRKP